MNRMPNFRRRRSVPGRAGRTRRALRARRGMTRKRSPQVAGVSERHLANLETGQGNASVMLLRQLARALGCTIAELVGEDVPRCRPNGSRSASCCAAATRRRCSARARRLPSCSARPRPIRRGPRRIALIGLRGAGKSTLGRMLADDLSRAVRRARPRRRAASPAATSARSIRCTARPPSVATSCARSRTPSRAMRSAVIATGGGLVDGAGDVRSAARALLHRLAARDARRAHEAGHRARRLAADGRQRRGDGGSQAHPRRPRGVLREGRFDASTPAASRWPRPICALREARAVSVLAARRKCNLLLDDRR